VVGERLRAWILAVRPRTLPAAVAPVVAATGLAAGRGVGNLAPAAAALAGALLIQIATNLANDYFDFMKGGDTEERLGPTRVVQAGLLSPRSVLAGTALALALATAVGAYLVWVGGLPILVIGLLALVCAVAYTGGPYPLAYHGLGDPFVFVFFGPVAVAGTYWVQARAFHPELLTLGAGMGALATAILVVNNLRDRDTDARAGKRTLAVRMGVSGSRAQYVALVAVAFAVPPLGIWLHGWQASTLFAWGALAVLLRPCSVVLSFRDPRELNPALGGTARGVAWYGGLLAVGFVVGGGGG
jgi:1,4-dihydroxy-2-naphthoate polyprenyltransferase